MTTIILLRYLHFIAIFMVVSALVAEHLLYQPQLKRSVIKRLSMIDTVYGIGAILLVGAGLTLWLGGFSKTPEYYSNNWIFLLKLSLAILLGILSIYPTVLFFRLRKGDAEEEVKLPKTVIWIIRLELLIVFSLPLLASMMANGWGIM
jgi:putative membrane protein